MPDLFEGDEPTADDIDSGEAASAEPYGVSTSSVDIVESCGDKSEEVLDDDLHLGSVERDFPRPLRPPCPLQSSPKFQ